ncbi:MAG: hypothetical protein LBI42_02125 [Chitinispirillales bacterium]|jgi:V/A-type H+-transporting ATPase subunit K|nr:hypothetical protein [Chitinispirillales bacterium]
MEYTLALVGMGLMIGLSATGAGIGFGLLAQTAIGGLKKRPEAWGNLLVLSAVPSSQGLYGFVAFIMYNTSLTAIVAAGPMTMTQGAIFFGAGIAVGLACMITCIYQAKICASGALSIAEGNNVLGNTLILAAFPEFFAILSLVAAILMQGALGIGA